MGYLMYTKNISSGGDYYRQHNWVATGLTLKNKQNPKMQCAEPTVDFNGKYLSIQSKL